MLQTGLMVYELSPGGSSLGMELKTVIPLNSSAYDVALDTRRRIAYVACYDSGVAVVDMSDPYRRNPNNYYGMVDENHDGVDDRVLGYVQISSGSRATLVVDSETGLLYIGDASATSSGLKVVGQEKPRMEFLLQDSNGQFQAPGYLSAFDGDKPLLGVWLPGGAGTTLTAQLELYDRKGMPEQPPVIGQDAAGNDILAHMTTVYRPSVTLTRQSNKRTEAKYNFYIQNNATPDAVELGMLYDSATPNPALMITKQGGTLRAISNPPAWHNTQYNGHAITWGQHLRLDKTVSRPWVEWGGFVDQPIAAQIGQGDGVKHFYEGANSNFKVIVNLGPQPSSYQVDVVGANDAALGGDTSKVVSSQVPNGTGTLIVSLNGLTPSQEGTASSMDIFMGQGAAQSLSRLAGDKQAQSTSRKGQRFSYDVNRIRPEFVADSNNNYQADDADDVVSFVDVGLWDAAFDTTTASGSVRNGADEQANFVGSDSQRFYIRVKDPVAAQNNSPEIRLDYYTGTDHPAVSTQVLTRRSGASTTYSSKALMLVADTDDRDLPTDTGLPNYRGQSAYGQINHRTRMIATQADGTLDPQLTAQYKPTAASNVFSKTIPVFARSADERRRITVRAYNFMNSSLGQNGTPADVVSTQLASLASRYATIGIAVQTEVFPQVIDLGGLSDEFGNYIDLDAYPVNVYPAWNSLLFQKLHSVDPRTAGSEDVVYFMFVHGLGYNAGLACTDASNPGIARNSAWLAAVQAPADKMQHPLADPLTGPHEVGHLLTNKNHYCPQGATECEYGWNDPQFQFNLMTPGASLLGPSVESRVKSGKRLWKGGGLHENQFVLILNSRFVKPY